MAEYSSLPSSRFQRTHGARSPPLASGSAFASDRSAGVSACVSGATTLSEPFRGTTLPSLMTYLRDQNTPSVEFIAEAADVCGVLPEWLAFGRGFRTLAEQRAFMMGRPPWEKELDSRWKGDIEEALAAKNGLRETFPGYDDLTDASYTIIWRVYHAARAAWDTGKILGEEAPDMEPEPLPEADSEAQEVARRVGRYLSSPFRLLGVGPDDLLGPSGLSIALQGMLHPLELAIPGLLESTFKKFPPSTHRDILTQEEWERRNSGRP